MSLVSALSADHRASPRFYRQGFLQALSEYRKKLLSQYVVDAVGARLSEANRGETEDRFSGDSPLELLYNIHHPPNKKKPILIRD